LLGIKKFAKIIKDYENKKRKKMDQADLDGYFHRGGFGDGRFHRGSAFGWLDFSMDLNKSVSPKHKKWEKEGRKQV
jgi:hypothetical protein